MKVFLIIVAVIIVFIIVAVIRKNAARNYVHIESAIVCSRLFIDPDIEEKVVNLKKGGYIMVREGLDMLKISEATLKRKDIGFFETYNPEEPDRRRLVVAEKIDKINYTGLILYNSNEIIYYDDDQAYMAKVTRPEVHLKYSSGREAGFESTSGNVNISFSEAWGIVKKVYGDYEIKSCS